MDDKKKKGNDLKRKNTGVRRQITKEWWTELSR
jgi:hypothetical protein